MSLSASFSYHLSEGDNPLLLEQAHKEVEEVETEYLNWLVELQPDDVRGVNASAPFLEE